MAPEHRSILPNTAGLPWWGAVTVAVVATMIGVAFDAGSGDKELTPVFAALYVMGCIAAVLIVQQSAVFTAVIQPPLILFCTVPGAYWLFRGGAFPGLKAIVINCGYPLIERFPLMLFTAAAVLLIGMVRWYLGMLDHSGASKTEVASSRRRPSLADKLGAMLTAAVNRNPAHAIDPPASRSGDQRRPGQRPRRATPESRRAAKESASSRSRGTERRRDANGSAPTRSRHVRPPIDDTPDTGRPRRRRPTPDLRDEPPRRRRPVSELQDDSPRRRRGESNPRAGRDPQPYREAPESLPRRRRTRTGTTHHPVSRVRYRTDGDDETRARSRKPDNEEVDSWEYDI